VLISRSKAFNREVRKGFAKVAKKGKLGHYRHMGSGAGWPTRWAG